MIAFLNRHLRALAPIFRPPFEGLWITVLLYFAWCFVVHPNSAIHRGNLPDPDDYMYLDQVLDWLKGQGWFDNIQHRLDPPNGGLIHFSRLAMLPMAALVIIFEFLGLPPRGAATLMAIIEPLFLLAGLLVVIRWAAESFMARRWAGVTAYVTLFATGLIEMFVPGHVDHHGLVLLLIAGSLGCAARMMMDAERLRWALWAGALMALALTIALEILPWLIVLSSWLGVWAIIKGGRAAQNGLIYGLSLFVASALLLLVSRPPDLLLAPDVAAYSIVYVYFCTSLGAVFAGIALTGRMHGGWRWALAAGIAAVTGGIFLNHYPDLISGPWGGVNPALAKLILDNVTEAAPLIEVEDTWFKLIAAFLGPLVAFSANLFFFRRARGNDRWVWSLNGVLLFVSFLLTAFYQLRFVGGLGLFMVIPLSALLQRGWDHIGRQWQGRRKVLAEIGLLLLVGPLTTVLLPALADGRSFNTGVLLFPVHSSPAGVCDMYELEKVLRSPQLFTGKPRTIMNTMGLGPELMFRTPHMVMSAPYHEAVAGNLDGVRFFSTTDPAKAEAIARQRHVDLVVACVLIPGMYAKTSSIRAALPDAFETKQGVTPGPPFILQLLNGKQLPPWLKQVHSPLLKNYVVYEITPPRQKFQRSRSEE